MRSPPELVLGSQGLPILLLQSLEEAIPSVSSDLINQRTTTGNIYSFLHGRNYLEHGTEQDPNLLLPLVVEAVVALPALENGRPRDGYHLQHRSPVLGVPLPLELPHVGLSSLPHGLVESQGPAALPDRLQPPAVGARPFVVLQGTPNAVDVGLEQRKLRWPMQVKLHFQVRSPFFPWHRGRGHVYGTDRRQVVILSLDITSACFEALAQTAT